MNTIEFFGQYAVNIDAQNRIMVPVRFRDALLKASSDSDKDTLYISRGIEESAGYLVIYTSKLWRKISEQIKMFRNLTDEIYADRRLKKLIFASTHALEIDANGRALLPTDLRNHANIKKKIMLIGMQETIEIWDEEIWNNNNKDDKLHKLLQKGALQGIRLY